MRKSWILSVLLAFLFLGAVGLAAPTEISPCTTISAPGDYVLNASVTDATGKCITIASSDVVLDGAGYWIDGKEMDDGFSTGIYVYNASKTLTNVTIKNARVKHWGSGIRMVNVKDSEIRNVTAEVNSGGSGIYLSNSSNITIADSGADYNTVGIFISYSSNITVANNTAKSVYQNYSINYGASSTTIGEIGIEVSRSSNITLINNTATGNKYGIELAFSNNSALVSNIANENNYGIRLYYSNNNTLTSNTASSNKFDGFLMQSSDNNIFSSNTANANGRYGFEFISSSGNSLASNTALNNANAGFYPIPTISILSPLNQTYFSTELTLNVSATENVSSWEYSLDGSASANFTPNSTEIANLSAAQHSLTVFANDTSGNLASASVLFTVSAGSPPTTTTTTLPPSTTTTTPPQGPSGSGGGGGGGGGGIYVPLKAEFTFMNPPSTITAFVLQPMEFDFTIINIGNRQTPVSFSFAGVPEDWFSVSPSGENLTAGGTTTYKIKVNAQELGTYDVKILVNGTEIFKELNMSMIVETAKPTTTTTTTTTKPTTTTTTSPPSGITGAILFVANNPLVSAVAAVAVLGAGYAAWGFRKGTLSFKKIKDAVEKFFSEDR